MSTRTFERTSVADLQAVSLDALNARAELQTRTDRKYIVPTSVLGELLEQFDDSVAVLEIEGQRAFTYESVYFDTPNLDFYRAAAHRRRRRFKVRTRTYADSGVTMLEVKSKGRRKKTVKHRLAHSFDGRRRLDVEAERFVDRRIGVEGVARTLLPVLTTTYQRSTLLVRADQARVTIDVGLRSTDERGLCVQLDDSVIIETKTSGSESVVDRWLRDRGLRPQKVSKFGTSLGALRPDLPSNKWHRVIDRHFRPSALNDRSAASAAAAASRRIDAA